MPSIQREATNLLSGIPFDALIGGPMNAAVDAQVKSAKATADFIQSVAFHPDTQEVRHVEFIFESAGRKTKLQVPLLAIVPVPFLRIEELNINFKASISSETSSTRTRSSSREYGVSTGGSIGGGYGSFFQSSISFNANFSSKKDSSSTKSSKYSVEYTIDIACRAVQDDMPAGLAEILSILRDNIKSDPVGTIEFTGNTPPVLSLPAAGGSQDPKQGPTLPLDFIAKDADGEVLNNVLVEFACEDADIVVTIPRARTNADGAVKTEIKYIGKGFDNASGNLDANAVIGTLRVGARAPGAVGATEVDVKAGSSTSGSSRAASSRVPS